MDNRSKEKFELVLKTSDICSENYIIDSRFDQVAKSIGSDSSFLLPKGLYSVKVKVGNAVVEKDIALTENKFIGFEPIVFDTPAPLPNTFDTSEFQIDTASTYSKKEKADVDIGTGSKLFLFGSIPAGTSSSNSPEKNTDPAIGLTLRNSIDVVLVDFGNPDVGTYNWEEEPWAACDIDIDPGIYTLCVQTNNGNIYKQTVVTCHGWQTQVFLQPRNYGSKEKDVKADLFNSSILMSRIEDGFNPKQAVTFQDGTDYRMVEQIRQALKNRRSAVSEELKETLMSAKFDNPMLGIYAAHLLLQQNPDSASFKIKVIIENLRKLLGESHPEVEALALKTAMPTDYVFREFPMLAASWTFILEASVKDPKLIPKDASTYKQAGNFWSSDFWLICGNDSKKMGNIIRNNIIEIIQKKTSGSIYKDILPEMYPVIKNVMSNKKVKHMLLKHLPMYKSKIDEILSNLDSDKLIQLTQAIGMPYQKVLDLIPAIDVKDIQTNVTKFNMQLSADSDKLQKGKWGGMTETEERKISATVESSKISGLYNFLITVCSTNNNRPLTGNVKFYLHNSFLNPTPIIPVVDGKAVLSLNGIWGSFIVGAETDEGIKLELDLAEISGDLNGIFMFKK